MNLVVLVVFCMVCGNVAIVSINSVKENAMDGNSIGKEPDTGQHMENGKNPSAIPSKKPRRLSRWLKQSLSNSRIRTQTRRNARGRGGVNSSVGIRRGKDKSIFNKRRYATTQRNSKGGKNPKTKTKPTKGSNRSKSKHRKRTQTRVKTPKESNLNKWKLVKGTKNRRSQTMKASNCRNLKRGKRIQNGDNHMRKNNCRKPNRQKGTRIGGKATNGSNRNKPKGETNRKRRGKTRKESNGSKLKLIKRTRNRVKIPTASNLNKRKFVKGTKNRGKSTKARNCRKRTRGKNMKNGDKTKTRSNCRKTKRRKGTESRSAKIPIGSNLNNRKLVEGTKTRCKTPKARNCRKPKCGRGVKNGRKMTKGNNCRKPKRGKGIKNRNKTTKRSNCRNPKLGKCTKSKGKTTKRRKDQKAGRRKSSPEGSPRLRYNKLDCVTQRCELENQTSLGFIAFGDWGGLPLFPYFSVQQRFIATQIARSAAIIEPQLIISTGDNFYFTGVDDVMDSRFKRTFEDQYTDESLLYLPWYMVAGNHDYYGNVSAQIAYTKHSLLQRWKFPDFYYTASYKLGSTEDDGVVIEPTLIDFIFIDTIILCGNTRFDDMLRKFVTGHGNDQPSDPPDPVQSEKQWKWIEEKLKTSTAHYIFVTGHFPVYSIGEHGPTGCLVDRLQPMLDKYNVSAYIAGHDHNMQHFEVPTSHNASRSIHYIVSGMGAYSDDNVVHEDDVPKDSLKYFHPERSPLGKIGLGKGALAMATVTRQKANFKFMTGSNEYLHEIVVLPRY